MKPHGLTAGGIPFPGTAAHIATYYLSNHVTRDLKLLFCEKVPAATKVVSLNLKGTQHSQRLFLDQNTRTGMYEYNRRDSFKKVMFYGKHQTDMPKKWYVES